MSQHMQDPASAPALDWPPQGLSCSYGQNHVVDLPDPNQKTVLSYTDFSKDKLSTYS